MQKAFEEEEEEEEEWGLVHLVQRQSEKGWYLVLLLPKKKCLKVKCNNCQLALTLSGLLSLEDRRAAACESFMRNLKPSNPVYGLAMSRRITTVHSYPLRSCRNYNNKRCNTKRLSEFVSVKYLDFLS